MLTLHGFSASNYYNIVKYVLLYKGLPFKEQLIYGGGEEWLSISPVGKIPALTTANGQAISETTVICDYLEEIHPQNPLYPTDPLARAKVRQIMKITELYLELSSRKLIAYAFSGKPAPQLALDDARHVTKRGLAALKRLCKFSPYIAGAEFSLADIYVHYCNSVVSSIGGKQLEWDILAEIPGMKEWNRTMRDSDIAQRVETDRRENEPDFIAYISNYLSNNTVPGK